MIHFNEENHTYWKDGQKVPGVTTILQPLYTRDLKFVKEDVLQYKSELGTAVHKAVELHVLESLEYDSLVSPVKEFFDGYLEFERDTGFLMSSSEQRVYHELYGYAGTLDLAGELNCKHVLIDAKTTSALSPAVAIQLAAYREAYNDLQKKKEEPLATQGYALRLFPGKYRLVPFKPVEHRFHFQTFLGLLQVHRWCQANNKQMEIAA